MRIAPWSGKVEGIKFKVRAVGIRVNLFKGKWTRGSEYLTDSDVAKKQVKADHLVTLDANWWEVPRALIEVQTTPSGTRTGTGLARLLLEGLSGTAGCGDRPRDCYLEVQMEDASGTEMVSSKLYLQLYDNGGAVNVGPVEQGGLGFTKSAYDHSAEFLSDYVARKPYWNALLVGFRLGQGI